MQSLEGIAVIHPKKPSFFTHALFDFRRSIWLRPRATDEVVQYCKNCLLVSIHCLFPPGFACAFSFSSSRAEQKGVIFLFQFTQAGDADRCLICGAKFLGN